MANHVAQPHPLGVLHGAIESSHVRELAADFLCELVDGERVVASAVDVEGCGLPEMPPCNGTSCEPGLSAVLSTGAHCAWRLMLQMMAATVGDMTAMLCMQVKPASFA
jgi:hypothetical protein